MRHSFSIRDKSILIGLYLSKFDDQALIYLGFKTFNEAFNVFGFALGTKPTSIKNYRDEFDPFFPNLRKGWHKREIRGYCKHFLDGFSDLDFETFTELIKSFVIKNYEVESIIEKIEKKDYSETVAKRLATGIAAEEYFKINYQQVRNFIGFELKDTTNLACGFDFKLSLEIKYYCVEVKGLDTNSGSISMTEKEFLLAQYLKEKYCLFIVKNFNDKPVCQYHFDPLNSRLMFKKNERQTTQINYSTSI
ncbi:protein NO VEIN domain-containing protein [Mucilaginibacter psychrotolerans]|uniref:DUF3883 domain-containing protein n=1 Tax=Mucilaginibacter psychrotolerans TaxID=1524096 RepID=A0A4Y8SN56_9SPHI|nr:DUF3883 domain-containing protein [Mucilaginibacter psychrotolerans]TFF40110.1 DUF3883 domain-containing protein [Mucilaginibacter psychrotolerans]